MLRTLLIEDEAPARADLRAKLTAHPEVTVVGEAATVRAARALLARPDYDLVFLDVQLVGGNAFDLVADLRAEARIIFVTAHDAYALRAFEVNALDYLLKPATSARLAEALRRVGAALPAGSDPEPPVPTPTAWRIDDTVLLRSGSQARFVALADICVITANDNYTDVRLADGTKIFLRRSLKVWEEALPTTHFMRVHRTQIVNLGRVTRYERDQDEHTSLHLEGVAEPVAASRYRWTELRDRLATIRPAV